MSVYFIRAGRYVKVGYSETPERRFENLWRSTTRYSRPWDLSLDDERELLAVIDGGKREERECHTALQDYASGCEWFVDEPGVRAFIDRAQRGDFSPVARPEGEFIPVPHTEMLAERRIELADMIARRRSA